ncbi:unnamed protein product, partial [marine sediment metagenome]
MSYHGKPDWGLQLKKTVYTFDDLSELAVRLGSEVFFDRRGDVVFMDSFKDGLGKWHAVGEGDGNKQEITAAVVRTGGYSVKLTGGSSDPWNSLINASFPYPVLSKWGFEVHFYIDTPIDKIEFSLTKCEEGTGQIGKIKYDYANEKLQYQAGEDDYQNIETSFKLYRYRYLFNVIKLVLDLENNKYHRLIVNE